MRKSRIRLGYALLIPCLVIGLFFIAYPVVMTIYNSFFEYRIQTLQEGRKFVGLAQYIKLFSDTSMWDSLRFTLLFTVVAVALETVLGMVCALIMNSSFHGQGLIRALILLPWAIPTVVSGLLWCFIFSESFGIINQLLISLGAITEPVHWLSELKPAFWAITIADVWKTAPYMALLLLAGLQNISAEIYEAALLDGANAVQKLFKITLPLMKSVFLVSILFRTISSFRIYDLVKVLTNGAPAGGTMSLTMYSVQHYFSFGNIGYGAAASVFSLIITLLISLLFLDGMKIKMGVEE